MRAVDVFAGAGGLTVGLQKAGFDVVAAIEAAPIPSATYAANHARTRLVVDDVRSVGRAELDVGSGSIDLLAACPPCQGFTSLAAKWRRTDPRNVLVLEVARLAEELRPRVVMLENVPRLATTGSELLAELRNRLHSVGYVLSEGVLQAAHYGSPQSRKRLVLVASKVGRIELPAPTHGDGRRPLRTVRQALRIMKEEPRQFTLESGRRMAADDWHVVRSVRPATLSRIQATAAGGVRSQLPEELRPVCHRGSDKGFMNVYGRMSWDEPAPTITGGCTTFSKGRFGHPEHDRTISVREAALLQEFPRRYKFKTTSIDAACEMIGNAFPTSLARAVARQVAKRLQEA